MLSTDNPPASPWNPDRQMSVGEAEELLALGTIVAWLHASEADPRLSRPLVNLYWKLSDPKSHEVQRIKLCQVMVLCALEELSADDKRTTRYGLKPMKIEDGAKWLAQRLPKEIGDVIGGKRKYTDAKLADGVVNLRERAKRTKRSSGDEAVWASVQERLEMYASVMRAGRPWTEYSRTERATIILDGLAAHLPA
jgi:hypothetical protein